MANYWDTFKPGLLAGQDYWEDFTPEAPTDTGVVGRVTGQRYQPWEKGYHNIAGLVDDSGQYDAWYDPDPPPVTSAPDWGTPEGFENWKNRIALETGKTGGQHPAEGGAGDPDASGSYGGVPWQDSFLAPLGEKLGWDKVTSSTDTTSSSGSFGSLSEILGTVKVTNALFAGVMSSGNPLAMIVGGLGFESIKSILDGTHPAIQGDQDTEVVPKSGFITDVNTPTESFQDKAPQTNTGWVDE